MDASSFSLPWPPMASVGRLAHRGESFPLTGSFWTGIAGSIVKLGKIGAAA